MIVTLHQNKPSLSPYSLCSDNQDHNRNDAVHELDVVATKHHHRWLHQPQALRALVHGDRY